MEIKEDKKDELNSVIEITLKEEDYQPKVEKVLKEHRRTASMPGFRKGKVPYGIIRKKYGQAVLVDEVNKMLSGKLYEYINENNLEVLGNPLPSEGKEPEVDWNNPSDMKFTYDIGLAPEVKVDVSAKQSFDYYKIEADEKAIDETIENMRNRNGKLEEIEHAEEETDLIKAQFTEVNEDGNAVEGGIGNESHISLDKVADDKLKKELMQAKKGDKLTVDARKLSENDTDLAGMLGIKTDELEEGLDNKFELKIQNVQRLQPAELNEEFFNQLYPDGSVTSEEELRQKVKEELENYYKSESDRLFKNDVVLKMLEKVDPKLPDTFLKRWLVASNETEYTKEQVEEEYDQYAKSLKWQLIENRIIKDNEIEVSDEELREGIKAQLKQQFAYYGMGDPDEEMMKEMMGRFMQNQEEVRKINDQLYDKKLTELYKEKFKLNEKKVSPDEFYEVVKKRNKKEEAAAS